MATQPLPKMGFAEYLDREATSEIKSEYHAGEVFVMEGATFEHAALCARITSLLNTKFQGRCRVVDSSLNLYIPAYDRSVYPDVQAICGEVRFKGETRRVIVNPTTIFEVLSPSTRDYDKGDKADCYRSVPSLADYVLVDSERREVQHQIRQQDRWMLLRYIEPGESIILTEIGAQMTLAELYDGIL